MPKISVIVPVYNVEKYIYRCVDSILNQSFSDFDLILVDDGTPDNSGRICDEYALRDNRIKVIHQDNMGLSGARNTGIEWVLKNSDSQWICFIDSDDWVAINFLDVLYNAVLKNNVKIGICAFEQTTGVISVKKQNNDLNVEIFDTEEFYLNNYYDTVTAWGKIYWKEFFRTIRYPLGRIHEDNFTTYKVLFQSKKVVWTSQKLYYYFQNEVGITHSKWSLRRLDILDAFEECIEYFEKKEMKKHVQFMLEQYIWHMCLAIKKIKNLDDHVLIKKANRKCMRRLRRVLLQKKVQIKKMNWAYQVAYPKLMWVYWTINGIINKLS